ncbi:MAG: CoA transferase [Chloroflexota bacterium]|nr:CoA transferase [Chloroflexota bacterium]
MPLPLSNVRVVDFCQVFAGPMATMLLADQGADVIKVETPEGDSSRNYVPVPDTDRLSRGYVAFNRNKRNIVLDLSKPEGGDVMQRLVRWADVAVCNLRASVPERLGIAYEQLAVINPRLVYASITAYGEKGQDATLPGYDLVVQAKAGITDSRRLPDGTPVGSHIFYADMAGAMLSAYGIMLALRQRDTTGRGQKIEVNLLHTYLSLQTVQLVHIPTYNPPQQGRRPSAVVSPYRAGDGKWIHIHAATERQWRSLCRALNLIHLLEDPEFGTQQKRSENAETLFDIFSNLLATKPAGEWEQILKAGNAPCSIVQTQEEVWSDPQVVSNDMIVSYDQPSIGNISVVDTPVRLSDSQAIGTVRRPAPEMGEHTNEILKEIGYNDSEINDLRRKDVLGKDRVS